MAIATRCCEIFHPHLYPCTYLALIINSRSSWSIPIGLYLPYKRVMTSHRPVVLKCIIGRIQLGKTI